MYVKHAKHLFKLKIYIYKLGLPCNEYKKLICYAVRCQFVNIGTRKIDVKNIIFENFDINYLGLLNESYPRVFLMLSLPFIRVFRLGFVSLGRG